MNDPRHFLYAFEFAFMYGIFCMSDMFVLNWIAMPEPLETLRSAWSSSTCSRVADYLSLVGFGGARGHVTK